ncbi:MAG TPA: DNA repair protein RadA [Clostridiaceae bacterium]|nr:DNA repair protein RadA [Clostridiaceae bacterium]
MAKVKSIFVCQTCGFEVSGWMGKCPSCNSWNSFVEEISEKQPDKISDKSFSAPVLIGEVKVDNEDRLSTDIKELDRVLGGGMVKGSLILVGGDPGIGKSTLLIQVCGQVKTKANILYVSGEESLKQVKLRADRLGIANDRILMLSETNISSIEKVIAGEKPEFVIIDSIQTMYSEEISSAPGSVSQVRAVTGELMKISKGSGITIIIVGHVTKEGTLAGPRVLEHMVDTVLYFEGERHLSYRILRAVKNRFGSTNEIGIFEMTGSGLREVENPSETMLSGKPKDVPGSVVVSCMEGTRPLLIEVQALVCPTSFGMPRRMATGVDYNRITLLMAVLEKRIGMQLHNFDAYVNVAGGLKVDEPACDLGIVLAVASSFRNIPVANNVVLIGEVGLTGEIRAVSQIEKRVTEAMRIGFKRCIIPAGNSKALSQFEFKNTEITCVDNVQQALELLL